MDTVYPLDLPLDIVKSVSRKKTIRIEFVPPGRLQLSVPHRLSDRQLGKFIHTNRELLDKKLNKLSYEWQKWVNLDGGFDTFHYLGGRYPLTFSQDMLTDWYRKRAEHIFTKCVREVAGEMGVSVQKVRVRMMRSRWGSYSTSGAVSLNDRLILAPISIIRYVVVHELAHVVHHNHGEQFWKLVARYDTKYVEHRYWLRSHGWLLIL